METRILFALAILLLFRAVAFSAEIKLLPRNDILAPDEWLFDLNPRYSGAMAMVKPNPDAVNKPPATMKELVEARGWTMERDFRGDGGITHESRHLGAASGVLRLGRVIRISGQIVAGDLDRLKTLVEAENFSECLDKDYCPFNNIISFDSPGGSFFEASKLAEYIQSQNFVTVLERDTICESACALPFLAGYTRYSGFFFPRRFAHETARLGVHQPFIQLPEGSYDSGQVSQIVSILNRSINTVTELFVDAGVTLRTLKNMYATEPKSMYRLSLLDMGTESILVFGKERKIAELTREKALGFCASAYRSHFGSYSQALLDNLRSDERTFLTFEYGSNFVCTMVRDNEENWKFSICDGKTCELAQFGQANIYKYSDSDVLDDIATSVDNTEIGIALAEFANRTALLEYMRYFHKDRDYTFKPLPSETLNAETPSFYCGKIDTRDAGIVRRIQEALNRHDIPVGKPDGSAGPKTLAGISQANRKLLGRDGERVDLELLVGLGIAYDDLSPYVLCGNS